MEAVHFFPSRFLFWVLLFCASAGAAEPSAVVSSPAPAVAVKAPPTPGEVKKTDSKADSKKPVVAPIPKDTADRFYPKIGSDSIGALEFYSNWKIKEFFLDSSQPVGPAACRAKLVLYGKMPGKYDRLILNQKKIIRRNDAGEFELRLDLTQPESNLAWVDVGPKGEARKQTSRVHVGNWVSECVALIRPDSVVYRRFITFGVGLSLLSVTDSRYATINSLMVTPKLGFAVPFKKPRWDLGVNFFVNAAPLYQSSTVATTRFLGVNGRFGPVLPWKKSNWKIRILIGLYYNTMFVTPAVLGFQHAAGPQIYPAFSYKFKNGHSIGTYFKFSPVSSGFSFLSLTSREIAAGVSYAFPAKRGKRPLLSVSIDYANLNMVISTVTVKTHSLTAGFGMAL